MSNSIKEVLKLFTTTGLNKRYVFMFLFNNIPKVQRTIDDKVCLSAIIQQSVVHCLNQFTLETIRHYIQQKRKTMTYTPITDLLHCQIVIFHTYASYNSEIHSSFYCQTQCCAHKAWSLTEMVRNIECSAIITKEQRFCHHYILFHHSLIHLQ